MVCAARPRRDPGFVTIGNGELIERRLKRSVPVAFGGNLADYIPFYFTPLSPMLYNIKTGWGGIPRRPMAEIVIVVSSLPKLIEEHVPFVFTDRHAYLRTACFYSEVSDLDQVPWDLLQTRDFEKDDQDPGKVERYQAEVLVYQELPLRALVGFVCYNASVKAAMDADLARRGQEHEVKVFPRWFF